MEDFDLTPEAIEEQVAQVQQVDEFNESVNYDKFIVLSKKDISNFCRLVEPLTKQSIDDYGKCVHVRCVDNDNVELSYINTPYIVRCIIPNKSGKQVSEFSTNVSTIKRLITQAFASLVLVENEGEINIALCESLLYLETKPLLNEQFNIQEKECDESIDNEGANYVFKRMGASLALTERQSEKVIVVKNGTVNFNTGIFVARAKSPFTGEENFVLYNQVSSLISVLADLVKSSIKYKIEDEILALKADSIYIEAQIGAEDKIESFSSPVADMALSFEGKVTIINDNILRIITVVKNLDYLSDIVTVEFTKDTLNIVINNSSNTKSSKYSFPILEGVSTEQSTIKLTTDVLKIFLSIAGTECKYDLTSVGLGIETQDGKYLIRKS